MENIKTKTKSIVIILNYKDYEITARAVNSILCYEPYLKILIVDNNSPNKSYEWLKEKFISCENVEIIKSDKNGGYSYGNNYGIKYAINKYNDLTYICIMNPDVEITYSKLFYNLINKVSNTDNLAGIAPIPIMNNKFDIKTMGWKLPQKFDKLFSNLSLLKRIYHPITYNNITVDENDKSIGYVDVLPGSFFLIKKQIFESIGLFDERVFLYEEENILASKIKKLGLNFAISLNDYYLHNHKDKEEKLNSLNYKFIDFKRVIKSERHFILNYMEDGRVYWPLISMSANFHLFIEIPVNHFLKKLYKLIK